MRLKPFWFATALLMLGTTVRVLAEEGTTGDQPAVKTATIQLYNVDAPDAATALRAVLANSEPSVTISTELVSNKLIVGIPSDRYGAVMKTVTEFIKATDIQPAMVQADVLIVEVQCKDARGCLSILGERGKSRTLPNNQCEALITRLEKEGRVQTLSAPRISTTDNQAARILIGQSYPYVTGEVAETGTQIVGYRDVGIQVQMVPKVCPDGRVLMRIMPEISAPKIVQTPEGVSTTAFDLMTLETTVLAKDGETAIVGGLTRVNDHSETTEVLIFVTPHVLRRD
jgi:type II secretory pathway component GspD/PulD (secretin)